MLRASKWNERERDKWSNQVTSSHGSVFVCVCVSIYSRNQYTMWRVVSWYPISGFIFLFLGHRVELCMVKPGPFILSITAFWLRALLHILNSILKNNQLTLLYGQAWTVHSFHNSVLVEGFVTVFNYIFNNNKPPLLSFNIRRSHNQKGTLKYESWLVYTCIGYLN